MELWTAVVHNMQSMPITIIDLNMRDQWSALAAAPDINLILI